MIGQMVSIDRVADRLPAPVASGVRPPTDAEFLKFRHLIEHEIGIHLSDAKRPLLASRLTRRIRSLGLSTFNEYFDYVIGGSDPNERTAMFDAICTNETSFFREPRHFDLLRESLIPTWRAAAAAGKRPRSIRIWSAACASGEEP